MVGVLHLEPPAFSAIKQKGEALYKKARRGEKVDIAPRAMVVHQSRLLAYDSQTKVAKVFFDVESGVYIRSLAVELARRLGVGVYAHLAGLRRVSIGDYSLLARSVFAGGCFWCTTAQFSPLIGKGVIDVISGYTGGSVPHPTYDQVVTGTTGHREAALVIYDPTIVSYEMLLERFWRHIDPTDAGGQFADRGHQYTTALYYSNDAEKAAAHLSKSTLEASAMFSAPIATEILPATDFYPAEEYHQKYHEKEAFRYSMYREGSGRADFVRKTWGDDAADHETTTENLGNDIASVI
jgi:methionine-S-sulfoxide reductase